MIPQFAGLNDTEKTLLTDAIPLITVLIAGADGNIDSDEKEFAAKIMKIRGYKHPPILESYYGLVGEKFSARVDELISSLPIGTEERSKHISDELAKLNDIFPKMEILNAAHLYKSFTTFAEHVAKASGGFLGFGAVSRAEGKFVKLPMVHTIEMPEGAEPAAFADEEE